MGGKLTRRQSLQAGCRELDIVTSPRGISPNSNRLDRYSGARVREGDGAVAGGLTMGGKEEGMMLVKDRSIDMDGSR